MPSLSFSTADDTQKLAPAEPVVLKLQPLCPGSAPESKHNISFKSLVDMHFKSLAKVDVGGERNGVSTRYSYPAYE